MVKVSLRGLSTPQGLLETLRDVYFMRLLKLTFNSTRFIRNVKMFKIKSNVVN